MVYAVGLPLEGPSLAADEVLADLAAAGEPHDTRTAVAKGVSWVNWGETPAVGRSYL